MPWASTEAIPDKERLDEDGNCECNVCCNGTDGEDSSNSDRSAENQQQQANTNRGVEPHSVNRCVCVLIDFLDPEAGKQSSRAYAKVTREAATIHPWPIE